jgi:hypothetical protein
MKRQNIIFGMLTPPRPVPRLSFLSLSANPDGTLISSLDHPEVASCRDEEPADPGELEAVTDV